MKKKTKRQVKGRRPPTKPTAAQEKAAHSWLNANISYVQFDADTERSLAKLLARREAAAVRKARE
jgi:hypothetical protein